MNFFGRRGQVRINGKTYVGNNISINGSNIVIDGNIQEEIDEKKIEVSVLCNVDKIVSDKSIVIRGDVIGDIEAKMNVICDKVTGNVNVGMNVNCDDIGGNVSAGMTINCDKIKGNATANKINS